MKTIPPVYFFVFFVVAIALNSLFPVLALISFPFSILGIIIGLIGFILGAWAIILFNKNKTTLDVHANPSFLITSGPYQLTRNPIYFSMALVLLGEAIYLGSLTPFISPILFVLCINSYIIPNEEKLLEKLFGKEYAKYKTKVGRWGFGLNLGKA